MRKDALNGAFWFPDVWTQLLLVTQVVCLYIPLFLSLQLSFSWTHQDHISVDRPQPTYTKNILQSEATSIQPHITTDRGKRFLLVKPESTFKTGLKTLVLTVVSFRQIVSWFLSEYFFMLQILLLYISFSFPPHFLHWLEYLNIYGSYSDSIRWPFSYSVSCIEASGGT